MTSCVFATAEFGAWACGLGWEIPVAFPLGPAALPASPIKEAVASAARGATYWRQVLYQNIGEFDRANKGPVTSIQAIERLKSLDDRRIPRNRAADTLEWITADGTRKKITDKTVKNALPDARKPHAKRK